MKKLILSAIIMLPMLFTNSLSTADIEEVVIVKAESMQNKSHNNVVIAKSVTTLDPIEVAQREAERRMAEIESIEDEMKWFVAYKEIIDDYKNVLDSPETIYDCFSKDELDLLFRVVQAEVGDEWEFIHKTNAASVIFNRLYSEDKDFVKQDALAKVLVAEQFSTIKSESYKRVEVSEKTILACEYAFMIEDTTGGCIAFRSDDNPPKKWYGWERVFSDGAHYFYK